MVWLVLFEKTLKSSVKYKEDQSFNTTNIYQHRKIISDSQVGVQSSPEMENLSLMFLKLMF